MRLAVVVLLVVHGLLHLLGFVKAFGLAEVSQLSGATIVDLGPGWVRPVGALWLLAAVVLVVAAVMLAAGVAGWWRAGLVGLVLSQALIVLMWSDARAGTVANVLVAIAVALAWGQARFERATDDAVAQLYAERPPAGAAGATVSEGELATLPSPVARWLRRAGVVGRPRVHAARLRQRGGLRTEPDQAFAAATAEQYFSVEPPGFVWAVRLSMKGLPIRGRDVYLGGRGRMLITVSGLISLVDGTGEPIDQGTLLRFLGELVWFPGAALAPYLQWTAVDDSHADVTMTYRGVTARARYAIDGEGRVVGFEARRYLGSGADAHLEDWSVPMTAWARFDGVEVPVSGSVVWKLAAGDFEYYRWELTALEYDRPARF